MKTSVIAQTAAASFCGGPDSYREPQKIQRMAGLATNYYNDFFYLLSTENEVLPMVESNNAAAELVRTE